MHKPIVRLIRNLYGHQLASLLWDKGSQEMLRRRCSYRGEGEVNKIADSAVQDVVVLQDDEVLAGRHTGKDGR